MPDRDEKVVALLEGDLTVRDRRLLAHLAEEAHGRPVLFAVVEEFGTYEKTGLVTLSGARSGPLGTPDVGYFWSKITDAGRAALGLSS